MAGEGTRYIRTAPGPNPGTPWGPTLGPMGPKEYKYILLDYILLDSPGMNEHPIRDTETKVVPIESL